MTFEQLAIFVAVAEREHLTRAAGAIGLTPSAVSAAIRNLESFYRVALFHRVGRRIELSAEGRAFLPEAKAVLGRAKAAELMLAEMGGLSRGALSVHASQTVASYWLPRVLMRFHANHPGIELTLTIGNTATVARAVLDGVADLGFVEGPVDEPALAASWVASDEVVVVVAPGHPWADGRPVTVCELAAGTAWVMREAGSGTRAVFEQALRGAGIDVATLSVVLEFPSNEAVLSAVRTGPCAAVVSRIAAETLLREGHLFRVGFALEARQFSLLQHRERRVSKAAAALESLSRTAGEL